MAAKVSGRARIAGMELGVPAAATDGAGRLPLGGLRGAQIQQL